MTQIKNENKYGMNRMIWAEGRGLRAEGLGQRENRYGMNRMIWAEGRGLRAERKKVWDEQDKRDLQDF
ncbi:MAG TPA: hypothetical protein PK592_07685 [Candidatus Cloacimonas sp.]|nr:hypothetical protein [Candidatus Cloacimonas sp.]HPK60757.1 hypothetical protein [Candidatus Cloacimonas sp.]